jgi:hypothetical protein
MKTAKKTHSPYKKNQYCVCRFAGKRNGDVVVGRIESVRKNGSILIESLLGGTLRVKSSEVFSQRNLIVSKAEADNVVTVFEKTGSAIAAREAAVQIAKTRIHGAPPDMTLRLPPSRETDQALKAWEALSDEGKKRFAREVWADVLRIFAVG